MKVFFRIYSGLAAEPGRRAEFKDLKNGAHRPAFKDPLILPLSGVPVPRSSVPTLGHKQCAVTRERSLFPFP